MSSAVRSSGRFVIPGFVRASPSSVRTTPASPPSAAHASAVWRSRSTAFDLEFLARQQLFDERPVALERGHDQRRPAEVVLDVHVDVVVREQQLESARVAALGGDVERGEVALGAGVDVDPRAGQQRRRDLVEALGHRDHQRGPAIVVIAIVDVSSLGELLPYRGEISARTAR